MRLIFYILLYGAMAMSLFTSLSFQKYLNQINQISCGLIGIGIGISALILAFITEIIHNKIKGE